MDPSPSGSEPASQPGKTRTWWHPLLANLLRWQLGDHFRIEEEVPVGRKPLQIDVLLVRHQQGEPSEEARRVLAGLADHLGEITLLEFKSPSDTLRAGDLQTFLAYALLYRAQNDPLLAAERMRLVVLAPRLTQPYRDEMTALGVSAHEERPGEWLLSGGPVCNRLWLLETAALADVGHPLLALFSPRFLAEGVRTYTELRAVGYARLVNYLAQQVQQFRLRGEEFAMQHQGTEDEMALVWRDLLNSLTLEERLSGLTLEERLSGLPPEEILRRLPPEERLRGLPPEERLRGLSPEEREQLRRLLEQPPNSSGTSGGP